MARFWIMCQSGRVPLFMLFIVPQSPPLYYITSCLPSAFETAGNRAYGVWLTDQKPLTLVLPEEGFNPTLQLI